MKPDKVIKIINCPQDICRYSLEEIKSMIFKSISREYRGCKNKIRYHLMEYQGKTDKLMIMVTFDDTVCDGNDDIVDATPYPDYINKRYLYHKMMDIRAEIDGLQKTISFLEKLYQGDK